MTDQPMPDRLLSQTPYPCCKVPYICHSCKTCTTTDLLTILKYFDWPTLLLLLLMLHLRCSPAVIEPAQYYSCVGSRLKPSLIKFVGSHSWQTTTTTTTTTTPSNHVEHITCLSVRQGWTYPTLSQGYVQPTT